VPFAPSKRQLSVVGIAAAIAVALLVLRVPVGVVTAGASVGFAALVTAAAADAWASLRAWRRAGVQVIRRLPPAFAIGIERPVRLTLEAAGGIDWRAEIYDHFDTTLIATGMPAALTLPAGKRVDVGYLVTPTRRGEVTFAPAELRVRSRLGLWQFRSRLGATETRRVYPDFAQVARYAWLAGGRRLQEIGIKSYRQRGEGTDFKQLAEYRYGNSARHIDWKATLRLDKPIVREFQDERDQCVMLLIDCGRRMRADDREAGAVGTTHFDQVLNAVMLLAYVALGQGDSVGALTFGTPPGEQRFVAPRKGRGSLGAVMAQVYGLQPTPIHTDYVAGAEDLLRRQAKRALVIVITDFRDEDGGELGLALSLLRRRHLVLLASVRERVIGELMAQPLVSGNAALDVASAQLYAQQRSDAFRRLAAREALFVDAEPERLGIDLVNRYHAVKRAGLI
jgi:uncharacterized protein (DUF58 family)